MSPNGPNTGFRYFIMFNLSSSQQNDKYLTIKLIDIQLDKRYVQLLEDSDSGRPSVLLKFNSVFKFQSVSEKMLYSRYAPF